MAERRCDCCDLPVSSCGVEAERRQAQAATVRRAQLLMLPGVIPARYAGPCCTCGERFDVGAPIRPVDGNRGRWQCLECCPDA